MIIELLNMWLILLPIIFIVCFFVAFIEEEIKWHKLTGRWL